HILPLHDSGTVGRGDGGTEIVYYVMPYVEGESLRDRLKREHQLPVDEAIRIAREVASALDYAHRHGVVHRDIKPENILLHDGQALVADFGIALAASRSESSTRITETGMSLGTPQYMSPEQAMGEREITPKSDLYALGCVLYEMLVGEPPFTGPTAQAIIARVVTEEPRSLTLQRRTIPPHVEAAIRTALQKLPADRFSSAAQFAEALDRPDYVVPTTVARPSGAARTAVPLYRLAALAASTLVLGLAAGRWLAPSARRAAPPARFSIQMPRDHRLTGAPIVNVALSPDGRTIVYVGEGERGTILYIRRLEDLTATPLAGTEGATFPRFSPDGSQIAFVANSQLKRVAVGSGSPVVVPTPPEGVFDFAWADNDGFFITSALNVLGRLRSDGTLDSLTRPDTSAGELTVLPLGLLPGGDLLVMAWTQGATGPVYVLDTRSRERTLVLRSSVSGASYAAGHLIWAELTGNLYAAPFDVGRRELTGDGVLLATNVRTAVGGPPQMSVTDAGAMVYVPALPFDLVRVDRNGRAEPLVETQRRFHSPRVSPDGRRIAFDFSDQTRDVWLLDLRDRTSTRITFQNDGHDPTWSPDGRFLTFATARSGGLAMFRVNTDGSGVAESLFVSTNASTHSFTPDGRTAVGAMTGRSGNFDVIAVRLDDPQRRITPVVSTPYSEQFAVVSPDGRWLAYVSNESGRDEVYVRAFPEGGAKVLVSQSGGTEPVWSRSGRELFYLGRSAWRGSGDAGREPTMFVATFTAGAEFRVLARTPLFPSSDYEVAAPHANYDVFPDGRSFVMVRQGRLAEIVYVQNWPELARQRPAARR
ncbi:MAG TPA: protein kinase, partial [Gemmatimonadales bacterium]|nr:protein kinase [Gemmatimonadales bacterium]